MFKINLHLSSFAVLLLTFLFTACTTENPDGENAGSREASITQGSPEISIMGDWRLVNFESDGSQDKFKECDAQTIWSFTNVDDEPLHDGTATQKLVASAPDDCRFFGFEAKWAPISEGQLFISSTRVGGTGGASNAGLFDIEELTEDRLTVKSFRNVYYFER